MNPAGAPGPKATVTREQIRDGLHQLGLKRGDLVVAHASLKAFGHVVGGADAVIDGLLDALGLEGTLVMPSHTSIGENDVAGYDPLATPLRKNIGKIPETFWRRRDVLRGRHPPRHPWAAKGPRAGELLALSEAMQIGSQHIGGLLNRVAELDGCVLLLGCMHNGNTSVHTGQALAVGEDEGVLKRKADFMADFDEIDEPLKAAGVMKIGKIGDAEVRLMKSRGLFAVIKEIYHRKYRGTSYPLNFNHVEDPDFLSCLEYQGSLRAMRVLGVAFERVLAAARAGVTADELDQVFAATFQEQGGAFAEGGRSPVVSRLPLAKRGLWVLDGAIQLDGYHAALGRCTVLGPVRRGMAKAFQKVIERQDQVAAAIRPGLPVDELFRPLAGGLPFEVHRIGRRPQMFPVWGLGDPAWAAPVPVERRDRMMFEAGQILCIGIQAGPVGMLRDMYRVEPSGAALLSLLPRTLRACR
jgi:aminoglycoside 3-N-acetyltransferase